MIEHDQKELQSCAHGETESQVVVSILAGPANSMPLSSMPLSTYEHKGD